MDDGRAASDAVMASSGAHHARVIRYSELCTTNAPARLLFLLLLFFWVSKRKEDFKTQKKFFSRMKARTGSASPLLKKRGRRPHDIKSKSDCTAEKFFVIIFAF